MSCSDIPLSSCSSTCPRSSAILTRNSAMNCECRDAPLLVKSSIPTGCGSYLNRMRGGLYYCANLALIAPSVHASLLCYLIILNHSNAGRRVEPEEAVLHRDILLKSGKPEIRRSTVCLMDY